MTPILPFINDTEENIKGILTYCIDANVQGLLTFGIGMTLRYGNREYYYKKLDELFPSLKRKYMHIFGTAYGIKSPHSQKLNNLVKNICDHNGILYGAKQIFDFIARIDPEDQQLSLWSDS